MHVRTMLTGVLASATLAGWLAAQDYKNYELWVDGKTYEMNLNEPLTVTFKGGQTSTVRLQKKTVVQYTDAFVAFRHKGEIAPAVKEVEDGVRQVMLTTGVGTLIIIQEYSKADPTGTVGPMLAEITKEDVQDGFHLTREATQRTLKSGNRLGGLKATLQKGEAEVHYEVLAFAKKDQGILVVVRIDKEALKTEKDIPDLLWDSLQIKL